MAADFILRAVMEYIDKSASGIKKTEQGLGGLKKQVEVASSALGSFDTSAKSAWSALLQTDRATKMTAQQMGGLASGLGVASSAEVDATVKMNQLISAWNKGDISSEQLAEGLGELDSGAEQATSGFDKLKGTLLTAGMAMGAIKAGKAAYELAQLGAQSIRTRNAFTAISGSASEATSRLDAMRGATRGAMSEQAMMASASRLMQMGLAGNATELEQITTMATRLGSAMGKSAGPAVEEFSLMLANQSIPRLDTFGISASKVRTKMAALAKEFPGMSREARFMAATMEEGEEAMRRLGDAADDELLAFERMEAAAADLKAELGEQLAPAISDVLATGLLLLNWNKEIEAATQSHAAEVATSAKTYDEYTAELERAAQAAGLVVDAEGNLIRVIQQGDISMGIEATHALVEENYLLNESAWGAASGMEAAIGTASSLDDMLDEASGAADVAAGSLDGLSTSARTVAGAFGEMKFDREQLWNLAMASGASIEALGALARHLGIATEAKILNTLEGYRLIEMFGEGSMSAEDLSAGFRDLRNAEAETAIEARELQDAAEVVTGGLQEAAAAADVMERDLGDAELALLGVERAARDAQAELARIERDLRINVHYETTGHLPTPGGPQELQRGTSFFPGGLALIGEAGPELIALPRGSRVWPTSAPQTQTFKSEHNYGGDTIYINDQLGAALYLENRRMRRLERAEMRM